MLQTTDMPSIMYISRLISRQTVDLDDFNDAD